MEIINGGVTATKGFLATGINVGIKNNVKKDMAMVFSRTACVTAGTFTTTRYMRHRSSGTAALYIIQNMLRQLSLTAV